MRVTLVISSLSGGGAERVMSIMTNYWAEKGWCITLITLSKTDTDFYSIHSGVNRIGLDMLVNSESPIQAIRNNIRSIRRLRHEILASKPSAVISFMDKMNTSTCIALAGTGIPLIISERTDPAYHHVGRLWERLRRLCYPLADTLIVQSGAVKAWFEGRTRCRRISIIPNPVLPVVQSAEETASLRSHLGIPVNGKIVVAMGRLGREKGFDLLISAFTVIAASNRDWHLVILGEGGQRNELENLIRRFGMTDRIYLPGHVDNPQAFLRQADLFVMSSRYEGFPNALCEAMSCGLPVISSDCPSGPREIIRDGVDGILVSSEDVQSLEHAMQQLIADESLRARLATRAVEVVKRFSLDAVMALWERELTALTK